jgi:hypothetical protein
MLRVTPSPARVDNCLEHGIDVAHDLAVRESDHPITKRHHLRSPRLVVLSLFRVRIAVDLDAEPSVRTVEVGDVASQENVLAADVEANLVIAKAAPENPLRWCQRVT